MKKDYEQMDTWSHEKNKANSNPNKANQSQFEKRPKERKYSIKKGIRKNVKLGNLPKTNPICRGPTSAKPGSKPIQM